MRSRPWSIAQFAVAAVVLVVSLIGIIGLLAFDAAELTFSFAGAIQAFGVFPGLVLSLTLNGILMGMRRAPAPNTAQKALLVVEFVVVAALLVFHFYTDEAGTTLGLAFVTWPILIVVAVVIAIIAVARLAAGRAGVPSAPAVPEIPA